MNRISIKVEKTRTGFSAYSEKYAAYTTDKTVATLMANMVESINLYFEAAKIKKIITQNDLCFEMDITSVFDVFPVINVRALPIRLGMNYTLISQYATGRKKPSPRQAEKIMNGIQEIGRELSELSLIA